VRQQRPVADHGERIAELRREIGNWLMPSLRGY